MINILDAIETIKTRRKHPNQKPISYFISSKHGLDNGMVLAVLEQLLDSGVLYAEIVRGSESYRINKEAETKIRAAGFELEHMKSKQKASCLQSAADPMVTPSPDKAREDSTGVGISDEGKQRSSVTASRARKVSDSPENESLDEFEPRTFVVTSNNEQNSFIEDLNRLKLSCSSESGKIPLPLDNPPTPTLHPHSQGSEITRLAEIALQLHDKIQQERQCNAELRNENTNLKIKLGLLHQRENFLKTEEESHCV